MTLHRGPRNADPLEAVAQRRHAELDAQLDDVTEPSDRFEAGYRVGWNAGWNEALRTLEKAHAAAMWPRQS